MLKVLLIFLVGLCSSIDLEDQRKKMLNYHNFYRSFHEADPLDRSSEIEKMAQKYSEYVISHADYNFLTGHSENTYKGSKLGENIYLGKKDEFICGNAIDSWYLEKENYSKNSKNYELAEHFTQVVWKDTKLLGCGLSCNDDNCFVVCNYYPAGNVLNEYDENVKPYISKDDDEEIESQNFHNLLDKDDKKEKVEQVLKNLVEKVSNSRNTKEPLEKFRKEVEERHNYYRKKHDVGELKRDSGLEKIAQDSAESMLELNSVYPNEQKYNGEYISHNSFYTLDTFDGKQITDKWYSKKKFYNFREPGCENNSLAEDFTNLIWKSTEKIGCGYACKNEQCYGCCFYYPPSGCEYLFAKNIE